MCGAKLKLFSPRLIAQPIASSTLRIHQLLYLSFSIVLYFPPDLSGVEDHAPSIVSV